MIRRKKTTIFTDAKETMTVGELKKIIAGITKVEPENQRLYKDEVPMEDHKVLGDYQLNGSTAKSQSPAQIALTYRSEGGEFEPIDITPTSFPPELPEVMKQPDIQPHEQVAA